MYLFSRTGTFRGSPRQIMPWVTQITDYVNANSSLPVTAWSGTFGYPLGTVGWSTLAESQVAFGAATSALVGQGAYNDLVESAADMFVTPAEDTWRQIIVGEPGDPPPLGAVAIVTTATAVVDRFADALAWSVEIGAHVAAVAGTPVSVLVDAFGPIGGITWISVDNDLASAEASMQAVNADAGYMERLAASAGLFVPGTGHNSQLTRIA